MAGLCAPLSTLRQYPRGYLRMTRGRCGSLLLHRDGLAPSTPCRSPGALRSTLINGHSQSPSACLKSAYRRELSKPIACPVLIVGPVPVATRGRRTKGRLRWPPSTELCRSRRWANDGSVAGRSKLASFDHLVGAGEDCWWNGERKRLGSLEIDHQFELGWLLDRKVGGLRAAQNLVDIVRGAPKQIRHVWPIGHQTARFGKLSKAVHGRQPRPERQGIDAQPIGREQRIAAEIECFRAAFERIKRGREILGSPNLRSDDSETEPARRCLRLVHL